MGERRDTPDDEIVFDEEDDDDLGMASPTDAAAWPILIVDDDREVHVATRLALRGLNILGRPLALLDAYSAHECIEVLRQREVAVILLDVVMESEDAGINAVGVIRGELGLKNTRIILRTGQPGYAPAIDTIRLYDINDYTVKTELSRTKLYSALTSAIRSYEQICRLDAGQRGLQRVVAASQALIAANGMADFLREAIIESAAFLELAAEGVACVRAADGTPVIRAATGRWANCLGQTPAALENRRAGESIAMALDKRTTVASVDHVVLFFAGRHDGDFVVYLAAGRLRRDNDSRLLETFCSHVAICADNVALIEERTRELGLAREQLIQTEKMAALGQLAAGVAHEINNPLGYIRSNLGALASDAEEMFGLLEAGAQLWSAEQKATLHEAGRTVDVAFLRAEIAALLRESREGIDRVGEIVRDLKEFARVDSGQDWHWADLHRGLDSTLNLLAGAIGSKADVVKEYGTLPEVECLPAQLHQVFLNLLLNAVQAMGDARGRITLRSGVDGERVWLEFADTGCGIPEAIRDRIFDPFFTTKPVGVGTGLGLSLAYGIVEKHGGTIAVRSEVGQGSVFRIVLPIRHSAGGDALNAEPAASPA